MLLMVRHIWPPTDAPHFQTSWIPEQVCRPGLVWAKLVRAAKKTVNSEIQAVHGIAEARVVRHEFQPRPRPCRLFWFILISSSFDSFDLRLSALAHMQHHRAFTPVVRWSQLLDAISKCPRTAALPREWVEPLRFCFCCQAFEVQCEASGLIQKNDILPSRLGQAETLADKRIRRLHPPVARPFKEFAQLPEIPVARRCVIGADDIPSRVGVVVGVVAAGHTNFPGTTTHLFRCLPHPVGLRLH